MLFTGRFTEALTGLVRAKVEALQSLATTKKEEVIQRIVKVDSRGLQRAQRGRGENFDWQCRERRLHSLESLLYLDKENSLFGGKQSLQITLSVRPFYLLGDPIA